MAAAKKKGSLPAPIAGDVLSSLTPVAGVEGPGRWMVLSFHPASLYSLKVSSATSGVGKSLVSLTPYVCKMALIDAILRSEGDLNIEGFVGELARADFRVRPPNHAVVTHTIIKIRQEPKDPKKNPGVAYGSAVAYREFVHFSGLMRIAIDLATVSEGAASAIANAAQLVTYFGKRGGFFQFLRAERVSDLGAAFGQPVASPDLKLPLRSHLSTLDDFGPEANFDALNSYSATPIKRDKHRKFVQTIIPLGVTNVGPGFTQYESAEAG
jgi:hypothetical protein